MVSTVYSKDTDCKGSWDTQQHAVRPWPCPSPLPPHLGGGPLLAWPIQRLLALGHDAGAACREAGNATCGCFGMGELQLWQQQLVAHSVKNAAPYAVVAPLCEQPPASCRLHPPWSDDAMACSTAVTSSSDGGVPSLRALSIAATCAAGGVRACKEAWWAGGGCDWAVERSGSRYQGQTA